MEPSLGNFIRLERERLDLSVRKAADLAGVSASMISKLERGLIKRPTRIILERLARAFQIPPEIIEATARSKTIEVIVPNPPFSQAKQPVWLKLDPLMIEAMVRLQCLSEGQLKAVINLLDQFQTKER